MLERVGGEMSGAKHTATSTGNVSIATVNAWNCKLWHLIEYYDSSQHSTDSLYCMSYSNSSAGLRSNRGQHDCRRNAHIKVFHLLKPCLFITDAFCLLTCNWCWCPLSGREAASFCSWSCSYSFCIDGSWPSSNLLFLQGHVLRWDARGWQLRNMFGEKDRRLCWGVEGRPRMTAAVTVPKQPSRIALLSGSRSQEHWSNPTSILRCLTQSNCCSGDSTRLSEALPIPSNSIQRSLPQR